MLLVLAETKVHGLTNRHDLMVCSVYTLYKINILFVLVLSL